MPGDRYVIERCVQVCGKDRDDQRHETGARDLLEPRYPDSCSAEELEDTADVDDLYTPRHRGWQHPDHVLRSNKMRAACEKKKQADADLGCCVPVNVEVVIESALKSCESRRSGHDKRENQQ